MRSFQKALLVVIVGLGLVTGVRAEEVSPAGVVITNLRTTASASAINSFTYYQGDTLTLTGSVMYVGSTTNSAVQNLDGCVITVVAGQPSNTNVATAVGYSIVTNLGTWGAEFTIPAFNPTYIEVTVSNVSQYTYPRYRITTQTKLQ